MTSVCPDGLMRLSGFDILEWKMRFSDMNMYL